jgi:hypothetical protein
MRNEKPPMVTKSVAPEFSKRTDDGLRQPPDRLIKDHF